MGAPGQARQITAMQASIGNARVGRLSDTLTGQPDSGPTVQRQKRRGGAGSHGASAPTYGIPFTHPAGIRSPFRTLRQISTVGNSFSKVTARKSCELPRLPDVLLLSGPRTPGGVGGATSHSNLDNPRYVGIAMMGRSPRACSSSRQTSSACSPCWSKRDSPAGGQFTDPSGNRCTAVIGVPAERNCINEAWYRPPADAGIRAPKWVFHPWRLLDRFVRLHRYRQWWESPSYPSWRASAGRFPRYRPLSPPTPRGRDFRARLWRLRLPRPGEPDARGPSARRRARAFRR